MPDAPKAESDYPRKGHLALGCCFQKDSRLLKTTEFQQVFQQNQLTIKSRYFVVLVFFYHELKQHHKTNKPVRLGAVVSKKVSKRAVDRNRIKRLIREQFRQRLSTLQQQADAFNHYVDIVFIARPAAKQADNQQLHRDINHLWINRLNPLQQCEKYSSH
ncbi:ribonuclease P protein component [Ostreibacterium oceani]|uniref:Ribonuclease P protein component n=1 Tax=Ostreibacterium oceani TaxID=2654998 RepID=A0A6N7EYJ8_9GAMM|nr:ribonuclease P protein component [Ostreibacterium oceani]MPV86630.1 ribonuclease P protein component [Ostreibacterium oceani]